MLRERPGPDSLPCRSLPVHVNGGWPSPETNGPRCPSHRAAIEHVQRDQAPPVVRKRPFTPPLSRSSRTLAGLHSTDLPNSPGFGLESQAQHQAGVAQLVEQRIRNAKVGSSTLFTGTKFQKATLAVAFCFSGAASALQPPAASHAGALPRMSGKGFGLPFLPRPRCSQARRNPEQHSPQLSTPAPSSSALNPSYGLRWVGARHPIIKSITT